MMEPRLPDPFRVLILIADRLYADAIRRVAGRVFPEASFDVLHRVAQAEGLLGATRPDLLLTGVEMPDGDLFELLANCLRAPRRIGRVLVITARREPQVLATLRALPVDGVFDPSTDVPERLNEALRQIVRGMPYWSESVQIYSWRSGGEPGSVFARITAQERLVLAALADGSDDETAARCLGFTARAIKSTRGKLYDKLGVHHKGDFMRVACQLGFVLLTAGGVVRPGFSLMCAAQRARQAARIERREERLRAV